MERRSRQNSAIGNTVGAASSPQQNPQRAPLDIENWYMRSAILLKRHRFFEPFGPYEVFWGPSRYRKADGALREGPKGKPCALRASIEAADLEIHPPSPPDESDGAAAGVWVVGVGRGSRGEAKSEGGFAEAEVRSTTISTSLIRPPWPNADERPRRSWPSAVDVWIRRGNR